MFRKRTRQTTRGRWKIVKFTVTAVAGLWLFTAVRYSSDPLSLLLYPLSQTSTYLNESVVNRSSDRPWFKSLQFSEDAQSLVGLSATIYYTNEELAQVWQLPSLTPARTVADRSMWAQSIAISRDLDQAVVAGAAPAVQFWDIATGEIKAVLSDEDRLMRLPTLSADGTQLAGYRQLEEGFQLRVHNLRPGQSTQSTQIAVNDLSEILAIAFHPNGQQLAIASETSIQLWDIAQQRRLHSIAIAPSTASSDRTDRPNRATLDASSPTTRLHFTPDGARLTVWGYRRDLQQISVATGQVSRSVPDLIEQYRPSALSPDGQRLARLVGTEGRYDLEVVELASQETIETFRGVGNLASFAFSPDGNAIASCEYTGYIAVRSLNARRKDDVIHVPVEQFSSVSPAITYGPGGNTLIVSNAGNTVTLVDVQTGQIRQQVVSDHFVISPAISADAGLFLASAITPVFSIWDNLSTQPIQTHIQLLTRPYAHLAMSPDGQTFVAAAQRQQSGEPQDLWIGETATGNILQTLTIEREVSRLVFSPDGERFAIVVEPDRPIQLRKATTGKLLQSLERVASESRTLDSSHGFAADGALFMSSQDSGFTLWDTTTGTRLRTIAADGWRRGLEDITSVALSPDGRWIAVSTWHQKLSIWDSQTGKRVRLISTDRNLFSLAFSPDGQQLAGMDLKGSVTLWRVPPRFSVFP